MGNEEDMADLLTFGTYAALGSPISSCPASATGPRSTWDGAPLSFVGDSDSWGGG